MDMEILAKYNRSEDFWLEKLNNITFNPIFGDRDREKPGDSSHTAITVGQYRIPFSPQLTEILHTVTNGSEAKAFLIFITGLNILVHKYTGSNDILLSTTAFRDEDPESDQHNNLLLFFRTFLNADSIPRDLLNTAFADLNKAYEYRTYRYESFFNRFGMKKNGNKEALYSLGLVYDHFNCDNKITDNLELLFHIEGQNREFVLNIKHDTRSYRQEQAEQLSRHFFNILDSMLEDLDKPVHLIDIFSLEDRQHLLMDFGGDEVQYSQHQMTFVPTFQDQVEQTPHTPAVRCRQQALTYQQLNETSNQVAHWFLKEILLRPEDLVAIIMERSEKMVQTIIATWKCGAAYVPIDPDFPADRVKTIIEDAKVKLVIYETGILHPQLTEELKSLTRMVSLAEIQKHIENQSEFKTNPGKSICPDNLAYVIYTSGSTGKPKGAMVKHQGMMNHLFAKVADIEITAASIIAQNASQCFDISVWQFFAALLTGGQTIIYTNQLVLNPEEFIKQIDSRCVTILEVVPSYLAMMLDIMEERKLDNGFNQLLYLLVTGETVRPNLVKQWFEKFPGIKMVNAYGPTEASDDITHFKMDRFPGSGTESIPIGRTVRNLHIYIVDKQMKLCPIGVKGEIFVSGVGIGRGYLNRPELTAEKFCLRQPGALFEKTRCFPLDPRKNFLLNNQKLLRGVQGGGFLEKNPPGRRRQEIYKTGDLARWLWDGNIEFFGRKDYQVKIRGYRIELEEIENKLSRLEGIRDAVVLDREDQADNKYLCAYVTLKDGTNKKIGEIKRELRGILPEYMIPANIVVLTTLPLTPNGKVDRKALPEPDAADLSGLKYTPPRNATEKKLAEIFKEVLGIEKVGIYDNFFNLGGDSFKGIRIVNKIQEWLHEVVHVTILFLAPTVEELAVKLESYNVAKHTRVDDAKIAKMRQLIPPLPPLPQHKKSATKNPPAIFILCPPRSGSTLLRVILTGHPRLFAPQEFELMTFNTLQERKEGLSGKFSFYLEGVIRAIMEIKGIDADQAKSIMEELEQKNLTCQEFYRLLQEWLGTKVLIEKTPAYTLDMEILKRVEEYFDSPLYIHLIRNPYAVIHSFEKAKLDQIFKYEHDFPPRELAELVWVISHQNILEFLKQIPENRQWQVNYEEMVKDPEQVVSGICRFLGVEYYQSMIQVYENPSKRMTDGIYTESKMLGDVKFFSHSSINTGSVEKWKEKYKTEFLGEEAVRLARSYGYLREVNKPDYSGLKTVSKAEYYPLSPAQKRLWILDQFEQGQIAYNIPNVYILEGNLKQEVLEKAFSTLIERHENLRTVFIKINGEPRQKIHPPRLSGSKLEYIDLRNQANREEQAKIMVIKEAETPFNLEQGPLLRTRLIHLEKNKYIFMFTMHHIISDGWSMRLLTNEVLTLYEVYKNNKENPLPPLQFQYKDYSAWQHSKEMQKNLEKQKKYWIKEFETGVPILNLPTDYPRPEIQGFEGSVLNFEISLDETRELNKLARSHQVSLFMFLLAVTKIFLAKISGQENILVGTPIAGRNHPHLEKIIGIFINTLVLGSSPHRDRTFLNFLEEIKEKTLLAFENQAYQFEELVEKVSVQRDVSRNPLFDVMFTLHNIDHIENVNQSQSQPRVSGLHLKHYPHGVNIAKFDLVLAGIEAGEKLLFSFEYSTKLFKKETIERFKRYFLNIISAVLQDPGKQLSGIDFISREEKNQLLFDFNSTWIKYPANKTLHELFTGQVEKSPDTVALVHEENSLTYREINEKSNRLAHLLREKGVHPDTFVGIILGPGSDMIAGLIAILKAGAAYLPIDPKTPGSRVLSMLNDSGAHILLTESKFLSGHSLTALQGQASAKMKPHLTAPRQRITQMDALPMAMRSFIDYTKYNRHIGYAGVKHTITLEATRGCPYKCTYCHKIFPDKHILRSAENIFSEVRYYYNLGVRRFSFIDDIFNLNKQNSGRFYQLLIENGFNKDIQLFFSAGLRGDILTEDYIDLMIEAGTVSVSPALETASPRLQKLIGKNLDLEKFRRNVEYFCEKYPQVITELFLMHGFPTETEAEVRQTMDFVNSLKWIHFPYINILRIYSSTKMAKFAQENGISYEAIIRSEDLAWHLLPETLPFPKRFSLKLQTEFLNEYLLCKERLLHVLPHQMQVMTEDELVQKYNSYFPVEIDSFSRLLEFTGIKPEELTPAKFITEDRFIVPDLNEKLRNTSPLDLPGPNALNVLLMDLNLYFSHEANMLYDLVDEPLGLIRLLTHLQKEFGSRINGKIVKSRLDFDNYSELKALLEKFKPHVIGIRTITFYRDFIHKTILMMRQWGIDVPIIVGGPHVTTNYPAVLQDPNIDIAVLGEGEITLTELVGKIMENQGKLPGEEILEKIPGLAFIPGKEMRRREFARELILLDAAQAPAGILSQRPADNPKNINQPGDLAYAIFTSGTTGKPKGVIARHQNVNAYLQAFCREFAITPADTVIQLNSFTFDIFVEEVLPILLRGGKLIIPDEFTRLDVEALTRLIARHNVSIIDCTPLLLNEFNRLASGVPSIPDNNPLKSVKTFISGGDVLKKEYIDKLLTVGTVYNTYGPTESTVCVTYYQYPPIVETVETNAAATSTKILIGKPIANYKVYILDKSNSLQPLGTAGELCVSGPGLTRGYLNHPELTAEKFVRVVAGQSTSVFGNSLKTNDRYYRTGDLARFLADGNIEFLGRIDSQVKIRGFRIELQEIERQLVKHPEIKDAVTIGREDNGRDTYLCAYIVNRNPGHIETAADELKEYLSRTLPDYMIPLYFVYLKELPLSPSGKILRKDLPAPHGGASGDYIAPGDEVEERISLLWSEVLGISKDAISMKHNFFELGGHSLKATILISKLHKEFNVKVPLVEIFKTPTIHALAQLIRESAGDKYDSIEPVEKKEYYPLSSAQKRLYFLQQMDLNSTSYNIPLVLPLGKELDIPKLGSTLDRLITRHECLRTSFEHVHELPVQRIHPNDNIVFSMDYFEADETAAADVVTNYIKPFDLAQAPLLRSGIIKHPDNNHTWIVDVHHIISDGTSHTILTEDFLALYRGLELESLRLQYKDFSLWQDRIFAGGEVKSQEQYWCSLYADAGEIPRLNLPLDNKRPEVFTFSGDRYDASLEGEDVLQFKALGTRNGATLYMNMLAVLDLLFYKYTGQTDIIIGTGIAGRPHADLQRIVGMFVNTLAMRNYPGGEKTYESFLKEVTANSIKAFANQDVQFEILVDRLVTDRDPSRNPLFDISMVVQNFRNIGESSPDKTSSPSQQLEEIPQADRKLPAPGYRNPTTKFDMTFFIHEEDEKIYISIQYYTAIFKLPTIQRLASHLKNIIKAVITNPSSQLKDIAMISHQEKNQVLYEFNSTAQDYNLERPIHELFEEQVEKTPDKVAVVSERSRLITTGSGKYLQQVTYKQLSESSNRLGRYLSCGKGIRSGDSVAILLNPSLDRPVSILGILKAGGAYVPIDPTAPLERIKYMLEDAAVSTVISEKKFLKELNRLQWECSGLHTYLCLDSFAVHKEEEPGKNELMDEELWHHVGENAVDDITGGGWVSSYTGEPFSREEMDEYGDNILKKLQPLLHPGLRVLEIGCASGISMFRIAPLVGFYYGTDLSRIIIEKNQHRVEKEGHHNIKLACLAAHEGRKLQTEEKPFDLVIINSVIQCFHGHNYLRHVIRTALDLLGENGYLFIGDVMDLHKKKALIRDLTAFKNAHRNTDKAYTTKTDFSSELFIDREFFTDLQTDMEEIEKIEFTEKIHSIKNELTEFRYDALFSINKQPATPGRRAKEKYQDDLHVLSGFETDSFHLPISSGSPAYIIYTSGTTGQPRGVVIEHGSLVNLCGWHNRVYQVSEADNATLYAGFAFDASVWELFPYLIKGASLHVIADSMKLDIDALNDYYEQQNITIGFLPTQMCEQFLEKDNRSLRLLLTGGDKLRKFVKKSYHLYNNYGPTENTVVTTYYRVDHSLDNIPIGKPIDNCEIYILQKESLLPQPIGIAGELCISGTNLSRGYLNYPELTNEKFSLRPGGLFSRKPPPWTPHKSFWLINKKFLRGPGAVFSKRAPGRRRQKLYKTGDLGRWLEEGCIEFLGRMDFQVKIRGFRIELGEIETRLLQHDLVREAIVIDFTDENNDTYLCAYIIPVGVFDLSELKEFLAQRVQDYMIPHYFISLDRIPLTSSGKVDRKALPRPDIVPGKDYVGPGNEIERKLVEIWSGILNIDSNKISIESSFFDLGGHSLKATILTSRIHKEMQVKIPLAEIFKRQTVRELARYIKGIEATGYAEIEAAEKREYYPLSSAQNGLYYIQEMDPESTAYNMPQVIPLTDAPDIIKLEETFRKLIDRHESLRTSYRMVHETPVQIIHDKVAFKIEYYDMKEVTVTEERSTAALINSFGRPFDLSRAPLLRVSIMKTGNTRHLLQVDMHHIITDGSSQEILMQDFVFLNSREELAPLKLQYKDFARWQNQRLQVGELKKQEEYWLKRFAGNIPLVNLPVDYPRIDTLGPEGRVAFQIDRELTGKIQTLVSRTGSTIYIFLLAVYTILLSRYSNREDIVIGCPTAGRIHEDLNHIIGLFVNIVIMRNFPEPWKTVRQFLEEVKENSIDAFENQDYQFEELMGKLEVPRYLNRNPLTDAVFVMQNYNSASRPQHTGNHTGQDDSQQQDNGHQANVNAQFDITLSAVEEKDTISLIFYFRKNLFKEETITRKSRHLLNIIKEVLDNPEIEIAAVNMLDQAEKEALKNMLGNRLQYKKVENNNENDTSIQVEPAKNKMEAEFEF